MLYFLYPPPPLFLCRNISCLNSRHSNLSFQVLVISGALWDVLAGAVISSQTVHSCTLGGVGVMSSGVVEGLLIGSASFLFLKNGQSRPLFCLFSSFTPYTIRWKHRWYAWDSNPGRQYGRHRQIHSVMVAPRGLFSFLLLSVWFLQMRDNNCTWD